MPALSQSTSSIPPTTTAALLLLARIHLRRLELPHPSAKAILEATGASRSRAYELSQLLSELLPALVRPVGRPAAETPPSPQDFEATSALSRAVLRFIEDHPGCVTGSSNRRSYADSFRLYILELRETYASVDFDNFAEAVGVPRGTLEDWLRNSGQPDEATMQSSAGEQNNDNGRDDLEDLKSARVQSVLAAWSHWHGSFTAFCEHVAHHLRIPYGRNLIARILHTYGERRPKPRPGRHTDEAATRDSFEVYFPGAQWVGDGMQVPVDINGAHFTFNLELDVDPYSGAIVGASVRDEEDSPAVVEAFEDGVTTTGTSPLALLLDWRPSNHTTEVDEVLGDTLRIRATKGRPQNKAHVEGAFGLFSQAAPPLALHADSLHDLAKTLLEMRVKTWGRTLNHQPRADRNGRSRVDIYREDTPSDEQIREARQALEDRCRKQEKRAATMDARADPLVRRTLDAAFERLGLQDPDNHIRSTIARYPRDAVTDGIAIFEGKKNAGTLPPAADGRYLWGIVREVHHRHESDALTEALIQERRRARDRWLSGLEYQRKQALDERTHPVNTLRQFTSRALDADRTVDRLFWLRAAGELIYNQPHPQHEELFRNAARRIHATFALPRRQRYDAERILARHVWPLT